MKRRKYFKKNDFNEEDILYLFSKGSFICKNDASNSEWMKSSFSWTSFVKYLKGMTQIYIVKIM